MTTPSPFDEATLLREDGGVLRSGGRRVLVVDADATRALRVRLSESLGADATKSVLNAWGHVQGWRVADALHDQRRWDEAEWTRVEIPALALGGFFQVLDASDPFGREIRLTCSSEAESASGALSLEATPRCWTAEGLLSGYLSRCMNGDVVVRERACVACGAAACTFVARLRTDSPEEPSATVEPVRSARSPSMRALYEQIERVASTRTSVLITGESGVGKERIARALHERSPRASGPFVAVNCSAIPENLLESELFGHARGAYSGASQDRAGLFEAAEGGPLLLDEIGEISVAMQVKLLRVLDTHALRRVGENRLRDLDVRFVFATHRDLEHAVADGSFREDLFYRIRVLELRVSPLRERVEDVIPLAEELLAEAAVRSNRTVRGLSLAARHRLTNYAWPGNVRELANAMERAVALGTGEWVELADLPDEVRGLSSRPELRSSSSLAAVERAHILAVFARHHGNQTHAAAELDIAVTTLNRKLKSYGWVHP